MLSRYNYCCPVSAASFGRFELITYSRFSVITKAHQHLCHQHGNLLGPLGCDRRLFPSFLLILFLKTTLLFPAKNIFRRLSQALGESRSFFYEPPDILRRSSMRARPLSRANSEPKSVPARTDLWKQIDSK